MKTIVSNCLAVFLREVDWIKHDLNIISIMLLAPLAYPFILGTVYTNKTEADVPIVVVDNDHSDASRELIRMLNSHQLLNVVTVTGDFSAAEDDLYSMRAMGIVMIPEKFSTNLKKHQRTTIKQYLNTSRFLISNDINKAVNEAVAQMNTDIVTASYQRAGYNSQQAAELSAPLQSDIRQLYNSANTYGDFLLPGIVILILQQTLLIGFSESVAKEREMGTLRELIATSGNSILVTIIGKTGFYFLLSASYTFLYFTAFFSIFNLPMHGNIFVLILLVILLLWGVLMLGFTLSSFFHRKIIALQVVAFTSYPIFLSSGYSWPMFAMPYPIQIFSNMIPSTPFYHAFIALTQYNASFSDIAVDILQLGIIGICGTVILVWRLKRLDRQIVITG